MENKNYYEILESLWYNNNAWAKEINSYIEVIEYYADYKNINLSKGNSNLDKVFKFIWRVYRHFNDGEPLYFVNYRHSEEEKLKIVIQKIDLIKKVFLWVRKQEQKDAIEWEKCKQTQDPNVVFELRKKHSRKD